MAKALKGIDISSWNGTDIDWGWVGKNYDFCVIKCTGGMGYRNPHYAEQLQGARGAGLIVGHYHYAVESSVPIGNPMGPGGEVEAIRFLQESDIRPGEFACLDLEDKQLPDDAEAWTLDWLHTVRNATGITAFVYSFKSFMEERNLTTAALAKFPLWYAFYWDSGKNTPIPKTIGAWTKIDMWQWSGGIVIPQMPEEKVDQNLYFGTADDLRGFGRSHMTEGEINQTPITTPAHDWGGSGVVRFHFEHMLVQNVETGVYYYKSSTNGTETEWLPVTPGTHE